MTSLDTVKIKVDIEQIDSIDNSYFDTEIRENGQTDRVTTRKLHLQNQAKIKGLGICYIDYLNNEVVFEVSAKILREEYIRGINLNTLELLLRNLNKNSGLKLKSYSLENSFVLKCDCTDNLILKAEPSAYIDDLNLFRINHKYKVDDYINKASIIFTRLVKSYKERMTLYDKEYDLLHNDKEMANILARAGRLKDFKNVLRVESNITSFKNIRELFNVITCINSESRENRDNLKYIRLTDILQSEQKVNLKIFQRITEKNIPDLFFKYENTQKSFNQIEKEIGRKKIIKDCDYDIRLIREFIQRNVKGKISRYIRDYKLIMAEMIQEESSQSNINIKSRIENNVNEIRQRLSA